MNPVNCARDPSYKGRLKGYIFEGQPRSIGGTAGTLSAPASTFAGRREASSHSVVASDSSTMSTAVIGCWAALDIPCELRVAD